MSAAENGPGVALPRLRLHESLAALMATSEAGRVRVESAAATRDLWFERGRIVAVVSSRDDERIGSRLLARGVVPTAALHAALAARVSGECVGAALVRTGALPGVVLRGELETLSLDLLGRMAIGGGTLSQEAGAVAPAETRTLDLPAIKALTAALRASDTIEDAVADLAADDGWAAAETAPADGAELTENERYVLSLLKRPRTVDGLRRSALIDFGDVLRAVAVLTVTGHVVACQCRTALPTARPLAEALALAPSSSQPAAAADPAPSTPPAAAPGQAGEPPRRDVRAMLEALDEAEANEAPMYDVDGKVAAPAQRRRVATMLESAAELLAAGEERRAVRLLLTRALGVFPALPALLKLTELELAEDNTRQLALDRLQRILAKNPRCTDAWLLLASYWGSRGAPEKVRGCATKILAYDAENADARRLLAGPPPGA